MTKFKHKGKAKGKGKAPAVGNGNGNGHSKGKGVPLLGKTEAGVKKPKKKLRGFAHMKVYNPKRLADISRLAGVRAQQRHGPEIRWDKKTAKKMATRGGLARWGRLKEQPESAA